MIGFIVGNLGRGISVRNLSFLVQINLDVYSVLSSGSVVAVLGMPLTTLASRKNLELVRSLSCFESLAADFSGIS